MTLDPAAMDTKPRPTAETWCAAHAWVDELAMRQSETRAWLEQSHRNWDALRTIQNAKVVSSLRATVARRRREREARARKNGRYWSKAKRAAHQAWTELEELTLAAAERYVGPPTPVASLPDPAPQRGTGEFAVTAMRTEQGGDVYRGERESYSVRLLLRDPAGHLIVQSEIATADLDLQLRVCQDLEALCRTLNGSLNTKNRPTLSLC